MLAPLLLSVCAEAAVKPGQTGDFIATFGGDQLVPERLDLHVDYDLDPDSERFLIHVPADFSRGIAYGLFVWTGAAESVSHAPAGWASVLNSHAQGLLGA